MVYIDDLFFLLRFGVLKGAQIPGADQTLKSERLWDPSFFGHRLLVDVQGDPAICVTEKFLSSLYADAILTKQRCQTVTE